jgi:succinate dehydrogenase / fumarate reductase flavoprotein subunit
VIDERKTPLPGLYAAGECACVSVHGANRLGTNSLVDIVVFGRRGGRHIAQHISQLGLSPVPPDALARIQEHLARLTSNLGGESAGRIRAQLQQVMMDQVSVFREEAGMKEALATLSALRSHYQKVDVQDRSLRFNTELEEALELGYLLDLAWATTVAALARAESRGAHSREDFPNRDDGNWLKHSLSFLDNGTIRLRYKPVSITKFQPQERKY